MKKSIFRSVSALLAVVMILSVLPVAAFAATNFFQRSVDGYTCVGSGAASASYATGTLRATANPSEPVTPGVARVFVYAYDSSNELIGSRSGSGETYASAQCVPSGSYTTAKFVFTFNSTNLGTYYLYP